MPPCSSAASVDSPSQTDAAAAAYGHRHPGAQVLDGARHVAVLGRQRDRQHVGGVERAVALDVHLPLGAPAAQHPALVGDLGVHGRDDRVTETEQPPAGRSTTSAVTRVRSGPAVTSPPAKATQTPGSSKPWAWPHHQESGKPPLPQFFSP